MPLQDPSDPIRQALNLSERIKGKIYHNANAHEFAADMQQAIAELEAAISICNSNISEDPYRHYLKQIGQGEGDEETQTAITEDWLKVNGFRLVAERGDPRTKPEVYLRRRAIKGDGQPERMPFQCPFDLCIDIAPHSDKGDWYVWLFQEDPYRFVHVRQFRDRKDLIQLYEALTGASWEEKSE